MYKKVILPVGNKSNNQRAIKAMRKALELTDGEIVVLHVTEPISQVLSGEGAEEVRKQDAAQGLIMLSPIIEELEVAGAHFHTRVEPGTPAETIVRVADEENADLIVMFTDGRDGLEDMFFGSITERVLRNTGIDLLAVRQ